MKSPTVITGAGLFVAVLLGLALNVRGVEAPPPPPAPVVISADLNQLSSGSPVSNTAVTVPTDGRFETTLAWRDNDVFFLALVPEHTTTDRN